MPSRFITTEKLGSGWAAMEYWVNTEEPELGPFWEPYDSGTGRYQSRGPAEFEAKQMAVDKNLPYVREEDRRAYMIAHQDDA